MKKRSVTFIRAEWLQLFLLILPLAGALIATPFATERVPMQWSLNGRVNWTAPGEWGLLVIPLSMIGVYSLIFWREHSDSRRTNEDRTLSGHGRATRMIRLAISAVLGVVTMIQIAAALGRSPDASRLVPTAVALLIAFTGNFLAKLKPNRYVGFRIPWTMKSEHVWRVTHRFAGWLYTSTGLIMAILPWFAPGGSQKFSFLIWVAVLIIFPLWVAWRAAAGENQETDHPR